MIVGLLALFTYMYRYIYGYIYIWIHTYGEVFRLASVRLKRKGREEEGMKAS